MHMEQQRQLMMRERQQKQAAAAAAAAMAASSSSSTTPAVSDSTRTPAALSPGSTNSQQQQQQANKRQLTLTVSTLLDWNYLINKTKLNIRDIQIGVQDWVRVWLSKPSAYTFDYHDLHQSRTDSLLFDWSATGRSEHSRNVTGLKFESPTRTQSCSQIWRSLNLVCCQYVHGAWKHVT